MSESEKSNKFFIICGALVTLIVFVVLISWMQSQNKQPAAEFKGNQTDNPFQIAVYYFPSRINDAKALTYYFEEQGYTVTMLPSASLDSLKASRSGPSYIYFNQSEFQQAMGIKKEIETVTGSPVNAYRYSDFQQSPSMIMVFTEESS